MMILMGKQRLIILELLFLFQVMAQYFLLVLLEMMIRILTLDMFVHLSGMVVHGLNWGIILMVRHLMIIVVDLSKMLFQYRMMGLKLQ